MLQFLAEAEPRFSAVHECAMAMRHARRRRAARAQSFERVVPRAKDATQSKLSPRLYAFTDAAAAEVPQECSRQVSCAFPRSARKRQAE